MIELRHLRALTTLRETGSMVRAAERLHLTQSALSHLFREMEERHEQPLFVRKSRPLRFTSAGLRLLQLADEVLPRVAVAQRDLARLASGQAGRLNIAIECHSCYQWLMPTLDKYRDDWPEVELDLSSGFHFAPLPALVRGDLDLVVTSNPDPDLKGIHYQPLFGFEMVLAISRKHALSEKRWVVPEDLTDEVQITYPVERERLDVFQHFLDPAGVEPADVRTAELTVMMVQLAASGRGVCALPNWALHEYLQKGFVAQLRLGEKGLWSTLYAAVREEMLEQAYVEDFLQTARDTCFANLNGIRAV
ncbi:LysR family transcriptional regulator, regulator for metE and metH [Microbulbifer donghaiensis]|uniref:HTH-type transcriptional regulator MetR n=1 Tax=Microbulbifer donghaiensis TaxID=494016 RepID=A0A1M5CI97_9GAMM|nr:LysR family transcriptional regulator [Microbulbifer donghaiensis]SHF54484.1 LysR family transcriptional regulator, regulator for metE and metH [Microbulbifer donghaiensis]